MPNRKPFRFSWQAFDAGSAAEWRGKARAAEAQGFSAFHLADHYLGPGPAADASHPPQVLAAVPAMAMAAEATSTLKVGCRVFCCSYRPAAVLVKEAMTIDFLSEGRLELGLGAGWIEGEYNAIGVPYDDIGRRIDRLEETIAIAKAHRAGGTMNIDGGQARAVGFEGAPRPVGEVPLMIGGGSPRVLKLAGREADIASINFNNRAGRMDRPNVVTYSTAAAPRTSFAGSGKAPGNALSKSNWRSASTSPPLPTGRKRRPKRWGVNWGWMWIPCSGFPTR